MDRSDDAPSSCTSIASYEASLFGMTAHVHEFAASMLPMVNVVDTICTGLLWVGNRDNINDCLSRYFVSRSSDIEVTSNVISVVAFADAGSLIYEKYPLHDRNPFGGGGTITQKNEDWLLKFYSGPTVLYIISIGSHILFNGQV